MLINLNQRMYMDPMCNLDGIFYSVSPDTVDPDILMGDIRKLR